MSQLDNAGARVIDPVLSEIAQGYQNLELVGMNLFPRVPVNVRGGRIITFGKEAFMVYSNLLRAPGQNTKRIQFGYAGAPFVLDDYSLEGTVPYETQQEAENGPGIDLAASTVSGVEDIIHLRLEAQQAALATDPTQYPGSNKVTLSGTAQWSDPASKPFADIINAKESIRAITGKYPNTMIIGAKVLAQLQQNAQILNRLVYTTEAVPSVQTLAALFGIPNVFVGSSVTASDAGVFSDVWGKSAVLAYTNMASIRDRGTPSFGYTYQLAQYPWVEEAYIDRNIKSWVYPVDDSVKPVIAGAQSGFLIAAAVA